VIPTNVLIEAMANLIGADPATLGNTALIAVALVKEPFTPGPNIVIGDLVLADFVTSTPLPVATAVTRVWSDPVSGQWQIEPRAPAGSWHWDVTAGTNLPQTIYGFALIDNTGAEVYGTQPLPAPVLLTTIGQAIDLDTLMQDVIFTLQLSPMT
jgi:hypothetical protein